jgi:hypothetical protein
MLLEVFFENRPLILNGLHESGAMVRRKLAVVLQFADEAAELIGFPESSSSSALHAVEIANPTRTTKQPIRLFIIDRF